MEQRRPRDGVARGKACKTDLAERRGMDGRFFGAQI
jgi:hypothetical protein